MHKLWTRLRMRRMAASSRHPSKRHAIEFTTLERRDLMAIISGGVGIPPISAKATPQVLPNSDKLVAVDVHGTINQGLTSNIEGAGTTDPPTPSELYYVEKNLLARATLSPVDIQVTDQYRQYQPRVKTTAILVKSKFVYNPPTKAYPANEQLFQSFTYNAVVYLQASENANTNGRRYTVSVAVSDTDNGAGVNFSVVVPDNAKP